MEVNTLKCDECGKMRINDSNHWFVGTYAPKGWLILSDIADQQNMSELWKTKIIHFCGQSCALKWIGIKLGEL